MLKRSFWFFKNLGSNKCYFIFFGTFLSDKLVPSVIFILILHLIIRFLCNFIKLLNGKTFKIVHLLFCLSLMTFSLILIVLTVLFMSFYRIWFVVVYNFCHFSIDYIIICTNNFIIIFIENFIFINLKYLDGG